MGAQTSKKVGYHELRDSIPGSFVPDQDFDLFYSLCKVESMRSISTHLYPSASQLFFVVVEGEVHVQLTSPELKQPKPVTATVYTAGETIHFFNLTMRTGNVTNFDFGECLRNGEVKLALHFKSTNKKSAKVIGMDRRTFDQFAVMAKCNMHQLISFLGMNIQDLVSRSPFFKTITPEQVNIFAPLLKVRLSQPGKLMNPFTPEMANLSNCGSPKAGSPRAGRRDPHVRNCTPCGPIGMTLSGTGLSVPFSEDLTPIMQKLSQGGDITPTRQRATLLQSISKPIFRSPSNSAPNQPIFYPSIYEQSNVEDPDADVNRRHLPTPPGILMGFSEYWCRTPRVVLRAVLAATPCAAGYLTFEALDALFAVDPRFSRVLRRNYFMLMMTWLKPTVPLLRDMDDLSFALLSCKVFLRCYLADTSIYRKGDPSDYAYIILGGSIKEITEPTSIKSNPLGAAAIERTLQWGTLFGEVALATNSPYFSTTTTKEPSMVLALSKRVLDQIYNNNKAKLCEIRIRLMGTDVTLNHVIDHPRGAELFLQYLAKEHAAENLQFYCAVDKFDAMCRELKKQYVYIMKVREENIVAIEGAPQVVVTVAAAGAQQQKQGSPKEHERSPTHKPEVPMVASTQTSDPAKGAAIETEETNNALTSRDESESNIQLPTTTALPQYMGGYDSSIAASMDLSSGANSRLGSFVHGEESMFSTVNSSARSVVHYTHTHSISVSKPGSMDMGHLATEDASSKSNDTHRSYSVRSQESNRSTDSAMSEAFMAMHIDATELKADAEGHFGSPKLSVPTGAPHAHPHGWGVKAVLKKPVLESIISESNFSHLDDGDDPEMDGQLKFSLKNKPHSHSVNSGAAYSIRASKIALIEEGDEDEEGGKQTPSTAGAGAGADENAFSGANLKRALQAAVSLVESSDGGQPARTSSERTAEDGRTPRTGSAGAMETKAVAVTPSSTKSVPAASAPHRPVFPVPNSPHHSKVPFAAPAELPTYPFTDGDDATVRSRNTVNTLLHDANDTGGDQATLDTSIAADHHHHGHSQQHHKHSVAYKVNKQLHKIQKDIVELKEVARAIMQMYIYNGALNQLNLPGTMRLRTEAAFEAWSTALVGSSNVSAVSLVTTAGGEEGERRGARLNTEIPLQRNGSFDLDEQAPGDGTGASRGVSGVSGVTKLSSLTNGSYGASFGEGAYSAKAPSSVHKLGSIENKEFRASAMFISSFGDPSQLTPNEGPATGTSASIKTSLIPSPIKIPDMSSAQPINHLFSSSSSANTPAVTTDAAQHPFFATSLAAPSMDTVMAANIDSITIESLDMTFVDLFRETKSEILKLLRDDKFPRWKTTHDFQSFIASVKPYEKERNSGSDGKEKSSDKERSMNSFER